MSKRAYSVRDIEAKKWVTLPWGEKWSSPFGYPADNARWFISGASASGKSSFVMQLAKELCNYGRVLYMSYEEGVNQSFQRRLGYLHMDEVQGRFRVAMGDTWDELVARLKRHVGRTGCPSEEAEEREVCHHRLLSGSSVGLSRSSAADGDLPETLLHLDQPGEEKPAVGRRRGATEIHLRHEGKSRGV